VHGSDQYVGAEIADQTAWQTVATTGFVRLKLIAPGSASSLDRKQLPAIKEITSWGGLTTYDIGGGWCKGSITLLPDYNDVGFCMLLRGLTGGVDLLGDGFKLPSGTTPTPSPSGYATHNFVPFSYTYTTSGYEGAVPKGFTLREWRVGKTKTSSTWIARYTGVLVTGMTWEQPERGRAKVTFSWIGKSLEAQVATSETLAAFQTSPVPVPILIGDVGNRPAHPCGSLFTVGGMQLDLDSFTLTITKPLEFAPALLNDIDFASVSLIYKPAHNGLMDVTFRYSAKLTTDGYDTLLNTMMMGNSKNVVRLRYASSVNAYDGAGGDATTAPYCIDFLLCCCAVTELKPGNVDTTGALSYTATLKACDGKNYAKTLGANQSRSSASGGSSPWLIQTVGRATPAY
jgi:hypothetical protein